MARPYFSCRGIIALHEKGLVQFTVLTHLVTQHGVNLCCITLETNLVQSAYLFTGLESVKFFYVMEAMYLKALWPKHDATKFNTMRVARMSLHCELDSIQCMDFTEVNWFWEAVIPGIRNNGISDLQF